MCSWKSKIVIRNVSNSSKRFWATVCKTVRPMLSVRCLSVCLSCLWRMQVGLGPGHIVLGGDPAPPPQRGGGGPTPIFGPYLLWLNGWMDQDATWYGGRPRPRRLCVRWESRSPSPKRGVEPPNSRPMFIVAKRLDGSRWYLVWR